MKYQLIHLSRERLILLMTLALVALGGCSSAEDPKQQESEKLGSKDAKARPEPSSVAATAAADSKVQSVNSSFDAINREMAEDAKARRAQENKKMQNDREILRMKNAHESKENAKDRDNKMLELLTPILTTGIMTKGMMFMSLPDEAKCNHYGSSIKSITGDTDRAINFKRSELARSSEKPASPKPKGPA